MGNPTDSISSINPDAPSDEHIEEIKKSAEHFEGAKTMQAPSAAMASELLPRPPDMERLASALSSLTPDCDDRTLAMYRIAPMAREARMFPDMADQLHKLARAWCSGELRGVKAKAWTTVGRNGGTGKQYFEYLWKRFVAQTSFKGRETTLGSIYFHAELAGWEYQRGSDDADASTESTF
jgi:hypothetical protein